MSSSPLFPLPSELAAVVLGGGSFIDQAGLKLPTRALAQEFALNYGYDLDIPHQRGHVVAVFEDALAFLQEVILEGTGLQVPIAFFELQDPLQLLIWASRTPQDPRARWSCALLRVMHTLFHVDNSLYLRFLPEIQEQIFDRYERFLVPRADGTWLLKGRYEVPLVAFKRKESKDRTSMLLKLLHKPENVAQTIYDQIGIRLVAEDLLGGLAVIRFLLDHHVVMPTHIKPSRTRNLMVDVAALQGWTAGLPQGFDLAALSPEERRNLALTLTQGAPPPGPGGEVNPFSSSTYSAIQFTTDTLIRLPSPAVGVLDAIQKRFQAMGRPEVGDLLHIPELIQKQEEFTFFFAHEVQVMERIGFESNAAGPASHLEYKLRQREAARRRVLQGIVTQEASC